MSLSSKTSPLVSNTFSFSEYTEITEGGNNSLLLRKNKKIPSVLTETEVMQMGCFFLELRRLQLTAPSLFRIFSWET